MPESPEYVPTAYEMMAALAALARDVVEDACTVNIGANEDGDLALQISSSAMMQMHYPESSFRFDDPAEGIAADILDLGPCDISDMCEQLSMALFDMAQHLMMAAMDHSEVCRFGHGDGNDGNGGDHEDPDPGPDSDHPSIAKDLLL